VRAGLDEAARRFLESQRVGRLATVDGDGQPHVVPLVYALVDDSLYFVVDEKPKAAGKTLKRILNLLANPKVAVVVDHYEEEWSRLEYVLVRGEAAPVDDAGEYARVLARLRERYAPYRQMRLERGRNAMVRIVPRGVHHWRARR
jgi:PPOX class probable F420-dependent enzyme